MSNVHNPTVVTEENKEIPTGVIDNSNTVYTTSVDFVSSSTQLYLNGMLQSEGAGEDYEETDTNEITMSDPPKSAPGNPDKLFIIYDVV